MASNAFKTPLVASLDRFAQRKILNAVQILGKSLPCSITAVEGQIVTVNFLVQGGFTLPTIRVPIFGSEYFRSPTQIKDKGVVFPVDVYIGGVSGLGGGVAQLTQRGNLATLVFFPIGNKNWTAVDPNAAVIYGPNGVVLRDSASKSIITLTPDSILMQHGSGNSIAISNDGVVITGPLTINGTPYLAHQHIGVTSGPDDTGGVLA